MPGQDLRAHHQRVIDEFRANDGKVGGYYADLAAARPQLAVYQARTTRPIPVIALDQQRNDDERI